MLNHHLQSAIKDIQSLIELTRLDIEEIKEAKHNSIHERVKIKNDLISSFQNKKSLLDNELQKLARANTGKDLGTLLSDEIQNGLASLRENLETLHKANKDYAKYVVVISEFYNSLLESMFPRELDGYTKTTPKPASLLKVRA